MKKVIWTPTARKSLQQTADFLTEFWNKQVAEEFLNQLDYRISQIRKNPELAPAFENSEFRQLLIHKSTSLFYKNFPEYIKLLLIWDNRQNPAEMLSRITDANNG
jgi:plasmid stabilization system protein ParE